MARTGKIARLPLAIREELNHRLRENESGQTLLEWLNADARVQKVCKDQFGGEPVNDQNLSNWRTGGFVEWLEDQDKVLKVQRLSDLSVRLARASGGNLSEGLMAIAVGQIQQALYAGLTLQEADEGEDPTVIGVPLDKLTKALTSIRDMELKAHRLELDRVTSAQKAEALQLEKAKFQRTTAELFLKWFDDKRTQEIAEGKGTQEAKAAKLIQLWFGDQPDSIGPEVAAQ